MWIVLTVIAIIGGIIGAFVVTADAIERRWARWDAYQHPPDRVDERRDEDEHG